MENGREKQLIYVKDLVFRALYQWKVILVVALVFALALGAFAMLSNKQEVSVGGLNMTPQTQEKVAQLEARLEWYDLLIQGQQAYIQNASYMDIDPYAAYTCGFHLRPEPKYDTPITEATPVEQDVAAILRAYRSLVTGTETFASLAQLLEQDVRNLRDLVGFDTSTEGALGIRVYGKTQEEAQKLADALLAVATAGEESVNRDVKEHTLTVIPFQNGPMYDLSLADSQNAAYQKLNTYENERLAVKTELDRYKPTQLTAASGNPLLYAIVGAVLGAFLVVCFVWVVHLCSDKIYSARVLTNRTGVRVLGCVKSGKKRNFIDRWLRKLEGRSDNADLAAVAANIRNRCQDAKTLLIMGSFCQDTLTRLTDILNQAGISCKVCSDPTVKAEALETLPGCDSVVLAETCNLSRYAQVEWAMETVSDYQKKLLGCVLIDG